jgi:integrase
MALTESQIKQAAPGPKPYKLSDGRGLYLRVAVSGSKTFVREYQFQGARRTAVLGEFPALKLALARVAAVEIGAKLKTGIDPRPARAEPSVRKSAPVEDDEVPPERRWATLCDQFHAKRVAEGIAPATQNKMRWKLGKTFDEFGGRDVGSITGPEILALIERIQETGKLETAKDVHRKMSQVFQYAVGRGLVQHDPAQLVKRAVVNRKGGRHPGLTKPDEVGELMRALRGFRGEATTRAALLLSAYTFLRSTELRGAHWSEIDLTKRLWTVPGERMKGHYGEHLVPLSTQAVGVLEWLRPWTGHGKFVFVCSFDKTRHLSEATLNAALRRLGYNTRTEHCQHGFRTTFSTNMNEMGWNRDWIERQLCHVDRDEIRSAYNKALYREDRVRMMQAWGDWLDAREGVGRA